MPNYGLFVNSTFRPFSYAEMIQPVQQMNQTYEMLENYYGELSSSAGNLLNILPDSEARRGVEAYMSTMDTLQDKLSREGITRESKRAALGAKSLYNQYMAPTAQAAEKALKEQAKVNELRLTNPNILIQGKSGLGAIDTYLKDPQYSAFNVTANLDIGKKQLQEIAIKMMQETSVGKKQGTGIAYNYLLPIFSGPRKDVIDKYQTYNALKRNQSDVNNFLNNNVSEEEKAIFDLFDKHLNTTMASIGMTKENGWTDNQIQQASEYMSQAWYNAIGPTQYKQMQDTYNTNVGLANYKNRNTPPETYNGLTQNYQKDIQSGIKREHTTINNMYHGVIKVDKDKKIIYTPRNATEQEAYKKYKEIRAQMREASKKGREAPVILKKLNDELNSLTTNPKTKKGALQAKLDIDSRERDRVATYFINDFIGGYDQVGMAGLQYTITDAAEQKKILSQLPEKVTIAEEAVAELNGNAVFKNTDKTVNRNDLDFSKGLSLIMIGENLVFQTMKDDKVVYIDAESIFNNIGEKNTKDLKEAIRDRNIAMLAAQSDPEAELVARDLQQKADAIIANTLGVNQIKDNQYKRYYE